MNEEAEMDIMAKKAISLLTRVLFLAGAFTAFGILILKFLGSL
ncbi:MAG: hypothetical protein WCV72_04990 [Patescibacteria group bacterium]|jgi:hypothetical protein